MRIKVDKDLPKAAVQMLRDRGYVFMRPRLTRAFCFCVLIKMASGRCSISWSEFCPVMT